MMLLSMKLIRFELVLVIATLLSTTYTASPLTAIKARALAKHKSSETHVPVAISSDSQVSLSSVQKSETHTSGKKWRTVYSKYKGSEGRLQSNQAQLSETSSNVATPGSPHSTTTATVTFPGFANLGISKDQSLTKNTQDSPPIMPHQVDEGKKFRSGYLMPDEELLRKWTNSS